jgi:hypothetical protein
MSTTTQVLSASIPAIGAHLAVLFGLAHPSRTSLIRRGSFAVALMFVYVSFSHTDQASQCGRHLGIYMLGFCLYANCFLLLDPVTIPPSVRINRRIMISASLLFSPRLRIPQNKLPPFSRKEPHWTPSRCRFLVKQLWSILWKSIVWYYITNHRARLVSEDFLPPKDHLLRRLNSVGPREFIIRAYIISRRTLHNYLVMSSAHSAAAVIAVVCFNSCPASWPPLFGSLNEAYTMRRYYNKFWPQTMRKAFTIHSRFIVHKICRVNASSPYSRQAITMGVFVISGAIHAIVGSVSERCSNANQLRYYLAVGAALWFEDVVQALFNRFRQQGVKTAHTTTNTKNFTLRYPSWIHKSVSLIKWKYLGYVWVIFFQFWMIPNSYFPYEACLRGLK